MNQPMYMGVNDFVSQLVNGELDMIHPIPVQTRGGWTSQEPFPVYVGRLSEREDVSRLALYRTIQDAVNKGFLQRMNRSDIFRNKVESVCKEWDPECDATSLFEDRVTLPYDMKYHGRERQRMLQLLERIKGIESGMEEGKVDRSDMEEFRDECNMCLGNLETQNGILEENCEEYTPHHQKIWKDLAWRPHSFYKVEQTDHDDPKYPRFSEKQIRRHIPENIQKVFENGMNVSHFMERENMRLRNELEQCRKTVTDLHKRVSWLHSNMPKESRNSFMKWFDPSDSSGEESDDDLRGLADKLQEFAQGPETEQQQQQPQPQPQEEEEEEQEEEGPEEEEPEEEEPGEEEPEEWMKRGDQLGGNFYLDMNTKDRKNTPGMAFF